MSRILRKAQDAIKRSGLPQKEVAKRMGTTDSRVSEIMTAEPDRSLLGKKMARLENLLKLFDKKTFDKIKEALK